MPELFLHSPIEENKTNHYDPLLYGVMGATNIFCMSFIVTRTTLIERLKSQTTPIEGIITVMFALSAINTLLTLVIQIYGLILLEKYHARISSQEKIPIGHVVTCSTQQEIQIIQHIQEMPWFEIQCNDTSSSMLISTKAQFESRLRLPENVPFLERHYRLNDLCDTKVAALQASVIQSVCFGIGLTWLMRSESFIPFLVFQCGTILLYYPVHYYGYSKLLEKSISLYSNCVGPIFKGTFFSRDTHPFIAAFSEEIDSTQQPLIEEDLSDEELVAIV